jgi:phage terminase large subunit-like protein
MMTIQLNVNPHAGQAAVHRSDARFKVLAAGRRWGKTRLGVNECLSVAARGGRAWWVAPSYKMSEVGWRPIRRIGRQIGAEIRKVDRQVILPGGGWVQVRSADNPDSLRGEGLDFVVLDECAFVRENAWLEALRPSLSDRQGGALFISTPKGRNWFWRSWLRGQDEQRVEWESWRYPTSANPYIDRSEIEAARTGLPERIYRQEYDAEFIDDAGGVFRGVMDAATAIEQERAIPGHGYVVGVDWGKHNDFTVLSVIDVALSAQAYVDRFNQIDYALQAERLTALCDKFNPHLIIAESNAMGEPIIEQLQRQGLPVQPFVTTNATKKAAIEALALAFERGSLEILPDTVQVGELQAYEMERLPSGLMRYNAPAGMHDDTIIALALAWQGASVPPAAGETVEVQPAQYRPERRSVLWSR